MSSGEVRSTVRRELWGGIAAMLVAFPSAIAFGVAIFTAASPSLAGPGALAGIVGAAALGIVAPLVSRNAGFITAPCAPAAAVMSGLAAQLAHQGHLSFGRLFVLLTVTALVAGALQVAYGALRLGRIIKYIPYQVVTGYLSGVAVIIATAQIPKLLGVRGGVTLSEAVIAPRSWSWPGILVGLITIAIMTAAPRLTKAVPGSILGFAGGIGAYFAIAVVRPELWRLEGNPLIVGPVRAGSAFFGTASLRLGALSTFVIADVSLIIWAALTLSVLLSVDTLKTGVVLDELTRTRHNSNRELIGQGVANITSALAGGVPGAAAMGPTLINVTSGGRSPWSGVVEGFVIVVGFLAVGQLMAWVPLAALAGILLVVAWRMFDRSMFRLLLVPGARLDFVVIAAVIVVAETVGLIQASLVGVCLAILLFIRNQIRGSVILHRADLREMRSKHRRTPEEMRILDDRGGDGLFVQLKGDLFFGTTDQLFTELERDLAERRFILFDLRRIESMDYTAAHLLAQMQERLRERNGQLLFSGIPSTLPLPQDLDDYLRQLGVMRAGGPSVFATRDSALQWMEERILQSAGWTPPESKPPLELAQIELFQGLAPEALRDIEMSIERRSVAAGTTIFSIGDTGDEIFIVRSGRVAILLPLEGGQHHHLASLARGQFFGEMAFLDRGVRSAAAEAVTNAELFAMPRSAFDRVTSRDRALASQILEHLALALAARLRITDSELRALEER
ncbi:MAG TPA: SulP family inorganic anion transporter [Thermoanaerobaculia bacterium]|nr:SulP family inorganic anion transporter [Thermoanaerobaculia bacterium]